MLLKQIQDMTVEALDDPLTELLREITIAAKAGNFNIIIYKRNYEDEYFIKLQAAANVLAAENFSVNCFIDSIHIDWMFKND